MKKSKIIMKISFIILSVLSFNNLSATSNDYTMTAPVIKDPVSGAALYGFDPVAYFTHYEETLGVPEYEYYWQKSAWYFANIGNMEVFKQHPDIYMPQLGGYDPYAASKNLLTKGNPYHWVIYNDKIYIFYSHINRSAWLQNPIKNLEKAQKLWPVLKMKIAR